MQDGSNKHRPGYDLTFSAPKSVSMMAILGGDKRLIEAHNQAVDIAVRQVEALASTRVMTDGQSETVLTGNLVMALFNHDTSRDQEPQLHTHAVVANVTQHNGEWKTLSSDRVGKTGFIENVYANQIAFGKIYRAVLKEKVEALGYETEVVGKHGMWEMPGVPVESFSGRSQTIREAVGEDASLKSRDVAALDTRKSKQHVDPEVKMTEWMQTLKDTGFDISAYCEAADRRAEIQAAQPVPSQEQPDIQQAVTQAIAGLSDRKVQFTYTDVLARTVGLLPPEAGVIEKARAGIEEAISREQLTGNGEPVTAAILAQRQAEEAIRRETERRADEIVRKMAEDKPALSDGKTEQAVREIAGQERERAATSERESALPESVLREPQRDREAVRVVARENLLQERLQQMARDKVRDLQKEKTPGGD